MSVGKGKKFHLEVDASHCPCEKHRETNRSRCVGYVMCTSPNPNDAVSGRVITCEQPRSYTATGYNVTPRKTAFSEIVFNTFVCVCVCVCVRVAV
jgi:hypothetical protein